MEASTTGGITQSKRQQRGQRRIDSLLAAAEQAFAELGYDHTTTNHIAERATASPGTLYQFFPNKQGIAEALATRYSARLAELYDMMFQPDATPSPLAAVVERMVDTFASFHTSAPAFHVLILAQATAPGQQDVLLGTVAGKLTTFFAARAPTVPRRELEYMAEICVLAFRGFVPLLRTASPARRAKLNREVKTLLHRYLEPVLGS